MSYSLLQRIWFTRTVSTWLSLLARMLAHFAVLPFVLINYPKAEITLWLYFTTIIGFQVVADLGFTSVLSRYYAYVYGGVENIKYGSIGINQQTGTRNSSTMNVELFSALENANRTIYKWLCVAWMLILGIIGTYLVEPIVDETGSHIIAWSSWIITIIGTTARLYGNRYVTLLMGLDKIVVLRQFEALVGLITLLAGMLVIGIGGTIFALTLAIHSTQIIGVLVNRSLSKKVLSLDSNIRLIDVCDTNKNIKIIKDILPSAWRSGLGILMSYGLVQGSGLLYTRLGVLESIAIYLFALNLIRIITTISQAPLYSKLPLMAKLWVEGKGECVIEIAKVGMRRSYWIIVLALGSLALFGKSILHYLDSNIEFVDNELWALMSIGAFLERHVAMHMQLFTITNRVIWHIVNGGIGIIYIVTAMVLYPIYEVKAFPIAQIVGTTTFGIWFSARHSYNTLSLSIKSFELHTSITPAIVLILVLLVVQVY